MTLWLLATTPTRCPAMASRTIMWAPVYVLPEPGGPWTGRTLPARSGARRSAAASGRLSGLDDRAAGNVAR